MSDLGTLPGGGYSVGQGINQSGQVTGFSEASDHNGHAFLFSNGSMSDLGTLPGGTESFGTAINQSGQVTGSATLSGGNQHAFLFSNGSMSDLGTLPGGTISGGGAINQSGQVTGCRRPQVFVTPMPFSSATASWRIWACFPGAATALDKELISPAK